MPGRRTSGEAKSLRPDVLEVSLWRYLECQPVPAPFGRAKANICSAARRQGKIADCSRACRSHLVTFAIRNTELADNKMKCCTPALAITRPTAHSVRGTTLPPWLASHFGPSVWWHVPEFLGAIVVPLCALRGYFIWVRSHWYRWIGKGFKEDYEVGEVL